MSTTMKSGNMLKAFTNRAVVKRLNNKKIDLQKKLVSKIDNSWEWPGHVKVVLVKDVLYKIVAARIEKYKYSYVTLVVVKPVLVEGGAIETFFTSLQTKEFMECFNSENVDYQFSPAQLLCDLVFSYTGEVKSKKGYYYSCFKFIQPDENDGSLDV